MSEIKSERAKEKLNKSEKYKTDSYFIEDGNARFDSGMGLHGEWMSDDAISVYDAKEAVILAEEDAVTRNKAEIERLEKEIGMFEQRAVRAFCKVWCDGGKSCISIEPYNITCTAKSQFKSALEAEK